MNLKFITQLITLALFASCLGKSEQLIPNKFDAVNIGTKVSELSKSILIIYHASNGDYWFGSDVDGVYRYDGKIIVQYSEKDGLSSNRIRSIQEDRFGNIYFATLGGINKFDGKTISLLEVKKSNSSSNNWKLQPDDLWFSMVGKNGEKGPYRFDGKNLYQLEFPKHHLEEQYYLENSGKPWSPYEVYFIYKDSKGIMWFGTSNFGICRYDGKSFSWLYEDQLTNVPNGGSFGIRSIIEDQNGKYWFCNTRYQYDIFNDSINEDGKNLIKYKRQNGIDGIKSSDGNDYVYFMSIIEDDKENLWMATYDQGVWQYDGKNVKQHILKDGTKNATLFSIYKDRKGTILVGSHESGVYKFNDKDFEKFTP